MDLWDLARLLFRRWYFALPILLVSGLTAVFVSQSVEPDYRATGNVVMIPAPGDPADAAAAAAGKAAPTRPKNPWLDLGFEALGNAAILKVLDQNTLAEFSRAGLSESITVQMAVRSPIFVIEAVGRTPAQATATVREVIKVLAAEVAAQQLSYGALPQDTITTRTLTDGADVQTVTSKVKRVLIVTVGLGLLLTAAGTIGLDVLIRWRRNRRRATGTARVGAAPPRRRDRRRPGRRRRRRGARHPAPVHPDPVLRRGDPDHQPHPGGQRQRRDVRATGEGRRPRPAGCRPARPGDRRSGPKPRSATAAAAARNPRRTGRSRSASRSG